MTSLIIMIRVDGGHQKGWTSVQDTSIRHYTESCGSDFVSDTCAAAHSYLTLEANQEVDSTC